jgi:DNA-binding FrmR family transcriptional regulator
MQKMIHRLKRVEGQLAHVREDIAADVPCTEVLVQFMAAQGALNAAFAAYVKESLELCGKTANNEELHILIQHLLKK